MDVPALVRSSTTSSMGDETEDFEVLVYVASTSIYSALSYSYLCTTSCREPATPTVYEPQLEEPSPLYDEPEHISLDYASHSSQQDVFRGLHNWGESLAYVPRFPPHGYLVILLLQQT